MDVLSGLMSGKITEDSTILQYLSLIILILIVLLICLVAYKIAKKVVNFVIPKYVKKSKSNFDDILLEHGFYEKLAHVVPVIILYFAEPLFNDYGDIVSKIAELYLSIAIVTIGFSVLDSVDAKYKQFEISKTRPITAVLQVIKIVIYIVAGILIIAIIMGESPLSLLGGIGALSAVFSLVFKDPILGFVAGIQLTNADMLRVGDWISVPAYNAEGFVTEIGLTTVSAQQFDKNIVTIPSYSLITGSFVNMRGFQDEGARRFRKAFYVDIRSIRLSTEDDLRQYLSIDYLKDYIITKAKTLNIVNFNSNSLTKNIIDELGITNIEILRVGGQNYLDNHPKLRKDLALMLRSLDQGEKGMPLEVTAFADTTIWVEYEAIQEEIFDHLYLMASRLGLRLFQNPSGYDIEQIINE